MVQLGRYALIPVTEIPQKISLSIGFFIGSDKAHVTVPFQSDELSCALWVHPDRVRSGRMNVEQCLVVLKTGGEVAFDDSLFSKSPDPVRLIEDTDIHASLTSS